MTADIAEFVALTRAASGVPERLEDPAVIEQLAGLLRPDTTRRRDQTNPDADVPTALSSASTDLPAFRKNGGSDAG